MYDEESLIAILLKVMQSAIDAGDWKVYGACDPTRAMEHATSLLHSRGWRKDILSGSYWEPPNE